MLPMDAIDIGALIPGAHSPFSRSGGGRRGKGWGVPFHDAPTYAMHELHGSRGNREHLLRVVMLAEVSERGWNPSRLTASGRALPVWAASLLAVMLLVRPVVQSEFSCAAAQRVALTRGEWVGCRFVTQPVAGGKRPSLALE